VGESLTFRVEAGCQGAICQNETDIYSRANMLTEIEVGDLGTVLRKARENAGTSLTDAAEQAKMGFENLNRIETEKDLAVPLETVVRVAEVLNVDLSGVGWS
jgi:ribosome-binding protein aMBF1 (putative translation factor)